MKHYESPEFKQIAKPSNPAVWFSKMYFKADGKPYRLDSNWNEHEIGWNVATGSDMLLWLSTSWTDAYSIAEFAPLTNNLLITFIPDVSNTDAATIKYGALAAKNIVNVDGDPLSDNDIEWNKVTFLKYDLWNDNFVLFKSWQDPINPSDPVEIPDPISLYKHVVDDQAWLNALTWMTLWDTIFQKDSAEVYIATWEDSYKSNSETGNYGTYDYIVENDSERNSLSWMTTGDTIFQKSNWIVYRATSATTSAALSSPFMPTINKSIQGWSASIWKYIAYDPGSTLVETINITAIQTIPHEVEYTTWFWFSDNWLFLFTTWQIPWWSRLYQYSLSSAWNISTKTLIRSVPVEDLWTNPDTQPNFNGGSYPAFNKWNIFFWNGWYKMYLYIVHWGTYKRFDQFREFTLTDPYNISTATFINQLWWSTYNGALNYYWAWCLSSDGTKLYVTTDGWLSQYSLSTAWDISSKTFVHKKNISWNTVQISNDGTLLYLHTHVYKLSIPYQLSSAELLWISPIWAMYFPNWKSFLFWLSWLNINKYEYIPTGISKWYVVSDSSNPKKTNFIWVANSSWTIVDINYMEDNTKTWLTVWANYFLWLNGDISTTGTIKVWKAVSENKIKFI